MYIRYVFDEGSSAQNELTRGDIIREINKVPISKIFEDVDAAKTTLIDVFGPREEGFNINVKVEKQDGTIKETQLTKMRITKNTVLASHVKTHEIAGESKKVGYLVFNSFKERSAYELDKAFYKFVSQDIDELILDLRYNRGGSINVAQQLATQLAGKNVEGQTFVKYVHNGQWQHGNYSLPFSIGEATFKLNLDRVVVLTSGNTCSASELVINALEPFVEVVTVGNTTCGKPVGMYYEPLCDDVVIAINFQLQNALGFGDYFDGLPVDCPVEETIVGNWGNPEDALYKEGLYYLEHGRCSPAAKSRTASNKVKQPEMNLPDIAWRDRDLL